MPVLVIYYSYDKKENETEVVLYRNFQLQNSEGLLMPCDRKPRHIVYQTVDFSKGVIRFYVTEKC